MFTIFLTLGIIPIFIFILCLFALLIQTTIVEVGKSIKERNMLYVVLGICAVVIETLFTIFFIWLGFDFINSLLDKFF